MPTGQRHCPFELIPNYNFSLGAFFGPSVAHNFMAANNFPTFRKLFHPRAGGAGASEAFKDLVWMWMWMLLGKYTSLITTLTAVNERTQSPGLDEFDFSPTRSMNIAERQATKWKAKSWNSQGINPKEELKEMTTLWAENSDVLGCENGWMSR